jgi:hypothetical protein
VVDDDGMFRCRVEGSLAETAIGYCIMVVMNLLAMLRNLKFTVATSIPDFVVGRVKTSRASLCSEVRGAPLHISYLFLSMLLEYD